MIPRILVMFGAVTLLAGCVGDGDTTVERATVASDTPNSFLTYPNTQAGIAAGSYRLVVGPASGSAAGSATLTLTRDDGSVQTLASSWTAGSTATQDITLDHAGGLMVTASGSAPVALSLLRKSDSAVMATGTGLINLPVSSISSAAYGQAYYAAVDPTNARTTLAAWKQKNGFGSGFDANVIFRDAKDLGYGRRMYARRDPVTGNTAVYVDNFVVVLQPGSSTNYGPLNVEAAISGDTSYLIGTNAIEFSPANQDGPNDNGAMRITKFFTFDKNGNRVASADLDGRGVKHMPGMCWACHGGQTLPLDVNGKFQALSLRSAKFNLIDAAQLEYSPQAAYQRPMLESGIRTINHLVHDAFAEMKSTTSRPADTAAKWSADFSLSLAEGRYGSSFGNSSSDDSFVPDGWKQNPSFPSRPVGVEKLFKEVVEPHCLGCHSLQGTTAGEGITVTVDGQSVSLANAINFSSYEKFISYKSRIADYVYHRGLMPLSLRNYESFWKDPKGAPTLLASFLNDPTLFSGGQVIQPGLPVAKPGAARTVKSPVQLDANASLFAQSWQWRISSGPSDAVLSNATTARPVLTTTTGGPVTLSLTVSNNKGSNTASVDYVVDNSLSPAPDHLTFVNDIVPILTTEATAGCTTSCHRSGGTYPDIPVYWTTATGSDGISLYRRVMARVDLRDPENSKLLLKPTSVTHGGAIRIDTSTALGKTQYNTILNWIRSGAACGTDATICN
jgi:hypothetical protein